MRFRTTFPGQKPFFFYLFFSAYRKIIEREDELFIVQNIVKSLEVSEEKVISSFLPLLFKFV